MKKLILIIFVAFCSKSILAQNTSDYQIAKITYKHCLDLSSSSKYGNQFEKHFLYSIVLKAYPDSMRNYPLWEECVIFYKNKREHLSEDTLFINTLFREYASKYSVNIIEYIKGERVSYSEAEILSNYILKNFVTVEDRMKKEELWKLRKKTYSLQETDSLLFIELKNKLTSELIKNIISYHRNNRVDIIFKGDYKFSLKKKWNSNYYEYSTEPTHNSSGFNTNYIKVISAKQLVVDGEYNKSVKVGYEAIYQIPIDFKCGTMIVKKRLNKLIVSENMSEEEGLKKEILSKINSLLGYQKSNVGKYKVEFIYGKVNNQNISNIYITPIHL